MLAVITVFFRVHPADLQITNLLIGIFNLMFEQALSDSKTQSVMTITLGNNQKIVWNFLTDSEPFLCPESKNNIDFAESGQISRFREFP